MAVPIHMEEFDASVSFLTLQLHEKRRTRSADLDYNSLLYLRLNYHKGPCSFICRSPSQVQFPFVANFESGMHHSGTDQDHDIKVPSESWPHLSQVFELPECCYLIKNSAVRHYTTTMVVCNTEHQSTCRGSRGPKTTMITEPVE
jgi:hypothetical protein